MSAAPLHINTDSFRQGHGPKFLFLNFLYLCLLMGWTVNLPPLGRDYEWLAGMPGFGGFAPAHHLTALLLLWLCMVMVFFLTRMATRGPWWLGSVAAVLFMAHPVKAEAALHLSGAAVELLPTALTLAALLVYAMDRRHPGGNWRLTGLPLFCALPAFFFGCAPLLILPFLWEAFAVTRGKRRWWPPLSHAMMTLPGLLVQGVMLALTVPGFMPEGGPFPAVLSHPAGLLPERAASLVFLFYPVGLLPETAARFAAHPVMTALLFMLAAGALFWFAWRTAHPALSFGLSAAAVSGLFWLSHWDGPVDPVSLAGGGRLTLATAFLGIAAAGFFHRMMHNPRWRRTAVWSSAGLCVLFMLLHGVVNLSWVTAGRMVREFQENAQALAAEHPDSGFALAPDIGWAGRAPLQFAESIRHDTPFSRKLPVTVVAACDVESLAARVNVTHYEGKRLEFEVVQPYPPRLLEGGGATLESSIPAPPQTHLLEIRPRVFYAPERAWSLTYTTFRAEFPAIRLPLPLERPAKKKD